MHTPDRAHQYGDYNSLNAVAAISPNDVWAVGQYHRFATNSYDRTLAEHWDGTRWSFVHTPNSAERINLFTGVSALATNDVWAVGYGTNVSVYDTLIEHWDGTKWSLFDRGQHAGILTAVLALATNDVWAVGSTNYIGQGLIEHWDGMRWKRTLLPVSAYLKSISALSSSDIWVVGYRSTTNGSGVGDDTYTLHYDGTRWTHVPSPSPLHLHNIDQNWLLSVAAISPNDVWAVGVTRDTDYGILDDTLTEHWDGARWRVESSPDPGGQHMYNDLNAVVALNAANLWAVGSVGQVTFSPMDEHRDSMGWDVAATPATQGALLSIARDSGSDLWAVGNRPKHNASQKVYNGTLAEHRCTGSLRSYATR
ncbi:MAG: hypothetical protein JO060_05330 [Candidatus Eremiobacteraeota bacterium]|nr:hypothetical protein [Candidatus Eremiobacteraeota bacterium]